MPVFGSPSFTLHRQVAFCNDPKVGLRAIIAIHDTTLGSALGGCRMWPYGSEDEAVEDVPRLARGITYKAALGGGKSVIIGDPARDKSAAMFESFGRFVAGLGGRYIVAEDVGTSVADLQIVHRETEHVRGIPETGGGDPSPVTAFGVYHGVRAAVRHRLGRHSLAGVRVAVQGLGHVGLELCRRLAADGAELTVADIDPQAVRAVAAAQAVCAVESGAIIGMTADVFAPCALGAVLDDDTIPRLDVSVVAGVANNQLAEDRHGAMLRARHPLRARLRDQHCIRGRGLRPRAGVGRCCRYLRHAVGAFRPRRPRRLADQRDRGPYRRGARHEPLGLAPRPAATGRRPLIRLAHRPRQLRARSRGAVRRQPRMGAERQHPGLVGQHEVENPRQQRGFGRIAAQEILGSEPGFAKQALEMSGVAGDEGERLQRDRFGGVALHTHLRKGFLTALCKNITANRRLSPGVAVRRARPLGASWAKWYGGTGVRAVRRRVASVEFLRKWQRKS